MTRRRQPEGEVFGQHLRELRQKRGVTQHDLAVASGLTDAYVSNMETGIAVPSLTTVLRLAVALDCKVTALTVVFDKTPDLKALLPK
ncbi:MAG TPA: helix-turn-helix transcriptional regulator [Thermoanaerobaculia bacterium]|jgi:transcriptional regulator with XRE-family HTH domain